MASITPALQALRPGINFSNPDNVLSHVRWDPPLPDGFEPPTQAELDAEIVRMETPPTAAEKLAEATGLTVQELKALIAGK